MPKQTTIKYSGLIPCFRKTQMKVLKIYQPTNQEVIHEPTVNPDHWMLRESAHHNYSLPILLAT